MAAGMLFFFMIVIKHAIRTAGGNTVELEFQITLAERTNVAHAWCGHEPAGRLPQGGGMQSWELSCCKNCVFRDKAWQTDREGAATAYRNRPWPQGQGPGSQRKIVDNATPRTDVGQRDGAAVVKRQLLSPA